MRRDTIRAMEYVHHYASPLGPLTIAANGEQLTGLWFREQRRLSVPSTERDLPVFSQTDRWLNLYFSGQEPDFTPPLCLRGSEFRQAVWRILLSIPYGKTMTYGEIAAGLVREAGYAKMSAQAVGGAVGRNLIAIIIPCHRVVGANGKLTGYNGGIERKSKLLELESGIPIIKLNRANDNIQRM